MGTGSTLAAKPIAATDEERDCLGRAMYFESNRSDPEGLLAVGTVVMNRLEAAAFPNGGICAVVGQPRQFAPGVLTRKMEGKELQKVAEVTDAVLDGQRHPKVGRAMYFHTAGLRFPYTNMHYVAVAGGNAFYEKRKAGAAEQAAPPAALAFAAAEPPTVPVIPVAAPDRTAPVPAEPAPAVRAPPTRAAEAPARRPTPVVRAAMAAKPVVKTAETATPPARSRVALTPAALAPIIPPTVLNLPRP
ncbi:cell wall hydrolase [Methylobacterium sp. J-068]|nr:cell wall hydrolase [Methylobacterium sp. J-068]MCJ2034136.1 cell wall hydrolase [Methylobacterium sp. J-068]